MATILEHPEAQALLEAATLTPEQVNACSRRLRVFLPRYLALFARSEQRDHATVILEGKLSGLDRKTSEPIANQADVPRRATSRGSSAPPPGTTRPSWPRSAPTSERSGPTPTPSS